MRGRLGWLERTVSGAVILASGFLMSGCPTQNNETGQQDSRPQSLRKEDHVIPVGGTVSKNERVYVLSANCPKFSVGDVIVSGEDKGFLRKIIAAKGKDNSGNFVYETTQGTIAEAFGDGNYSIKSERAKLVQSAASTRLIEWKKEIHKEIPVVEGGTLTFDGEVFASLDLDIGFSVREKRLVSMGATLDGLFTSNIDVTASFERGTSLEERFNLAEGQWVYAGLAGGWFPVVVTVDGDIDLVIEAEANGKVAFYDRVGTEGELSLGARFDEGKGWQRITDRRLRFDYGSIGACMEGNARAKAYIDVNLEARLYDVVGPYFGAQPYLELEGHGLVPCDTNPKEQIGFAWDLAGGMKAPLGINAEIFGTNLWDFSTEDIFNGELRKVFINKGLSDEWPGGLVSGTFDFGESGNGSGGSGGGGIGGGGGGGIGGGDECEFKEQESNDTLATGNRVLLGCERQVIRGQLGYKTDVDYFRFDSGPRNYDYRLSGGNVRIQGLVGGNELYGLTVLDNNGSSYPVPYEIELTRK